MKKQLLLLTLFMGLWCSLGAQKDVFYVAATGGLMLRELPGTDQKSITKIPYGTRLEINSYTTVKSTVDGYEGAWMETTYNGQKGYVFGGYLLPVPLPMGGLSFEEYMSHNFGKITYEDSVKINEDTDGFEKRFTRIYANGVTVLDAGFWEASETTVIHLPFTMQQAYLWYHVLEEKLWGGTHTYRGNGYPTKAIKTEDQTVTISWSDMRIESTSEYFSFVHIFKLSGYVTISWGSGV